MTHQIHTAILAVMHDIALTGIAKADRNTQQGYNFRGIEAAMNSLSPLLVKHGISIAAKYTELNVTAQPREGKGPMRFVTIKGAFQFIAEDGSSITSEVYGEAMDSGDKSVVKAQSVAFRTALFQAFVVPTMAMDPEDFDDAATDKGSAPAIALGFAEKGTAAYEAYFKALTPADRKALAQHNEELKAIAAEASKNAEAKQ